MSREIDLVEISKRCEDVRGELVEIVENLIETLQMMLNALDRRKILDDLEYFRALSLLGSIEFRLENIKRLG